MQLKYSDKFFARSKKLPIAIHDKLAYLLDLLAENPYHPLLHVKRLAGNLNGAFSFRITRDWRVIFVFESRETIKLVEVGNRKDIYR